MSFYLSLQSPLLAVLRCALSLWTARLPHCLCLLVKKKMPTKQPLEATVHTKKHSDNELKRPEHWKHSLGSTTSQGKKKKKKKKAWHHIWIRIWEACVAKKVGNGSVYTWIAAVSRWLIWKHWANLCDLRTVQSWWSPLQSPAPEGNTEQGAAVQTKNNDGYRFWYTVCSLREELLLIASHFNRLIKCAFVCQSFYLLTRSVRNFTHMVRKRTV